MKRSALHQLRSVTRVDHDELDLLFSRFDLSDLPQYGNFLKAHAMAMLPIETMLSVVPHLPDWRTRGEALRSDLETLRFPLPPPLSIAAPATRPQALGMLYVLEGSRLGGAVLSSRVDPSFPCEFLKSRHRPGEWQTLLDILRTDCAGDDWVADVLSGAGAVFKSYLSAAHHVSRGARKADQPSAVRSSHQSA